MNDLSDNPSLKELQHYIQTEMAISLSKSYDTAIAEAILAGIEENFQGILDECDKIESDALIEKMTPAVKELEKL